MFIIFPIGTDAPAYHFPFATIGMILFCTIVFILQCIFPEAQEFFVLRYQVFNPIAWFTSCCMHEGVVHLIGNMVLLVVCGWIVEGKIGWWQFLIVFFGIGVSANVVEQLIMCWFSDGGSWGASGVIYGMLAIAMLWAPENKITLAYGGLLLFYPIYGTFEAAIMGLCFVLVSIEFLTVWFSFFAISSALLHLLGFVPGLIIGFAMLKMRLVDCDGYDLISIHSGNAGKRVKTVAQERAEEQQRKEAAAEAKEQLNEGLERVKTYIVDGHYEMAFKRFTLLRRKHRSLVMPEDQYVAIINGLNANEATRNAAVPVMESYLDHHESLRVPMTLNLAKHALLSEQRPRKCLKIMKRLENENLDPKYIKIAQSILAKSKRMIGDGTLEFADD